MVFHTEAEAEYLQAMDWYASHNPRVAAEFLEAVQRTAELVAQSPLRWPRGLAGTRSYLIHRFPYRLIYRPIDGGIQIVAVAHASRRSGYWRDRR